MWGEIERYDLKKRSILKKEVVKILHYIMLSLCALASIVIFFVSFLQQIVIASILFAYAYYIYRNPYLIDLILGHLFQQSQYMIIRKPGAGQNQEQYNANNNARYSPILTKSIYYFDRNKSYSNNESSINQSYSLNNLNDSYASSQNFSRYNHSFNDRTPQYRELNGHYFEDMNKRYEQKSQKNRENDTVRQKCPKMVILNRYDIEEKADKFVRENTKLYEEDLKNYLNIHQAEELEPKYKRIEVILNRLVTEKINMLNIFQEKIQRFAREYFNYTLFGFNEASPSQINVQYFDRRESNNRNFWVFLYQLLQTQTQRFEPRVTQRQLLSGKNIQMYFSMASGAIRETIKLSDLFGIQQMLSGVSRDFQIIEFLKNLSRIVILLNRYIQFLKNSRFEQEQSSEDIKEQMVDRIFILNFFVREFNRGARMSVVNIEDVWGFGSQINDNSFLHIEIKYSFDRYYPHLNLLRTEKGNIRRWNCAPKLNNYTSIIYLMAHELSQSPTYMSNQYIFGIVRSII